jgi:hypothetical protein
VVARPSGKNSGALLLQPPSTVLAAATANTQARRAKKEKLRFM